MFAERGFDAVTVNEIAEAAEVAKVTLFAYFPSKESLVLDDVGGDDLAAIVAGRPAGQNFLDALRTHHRTLAAEAIAQADLDALLTRVRVIQNSPALRHAAEALVYRQRQALAKVLVEEYGPTAATVMAAQIAACLLALQETYFQRLVEGASAEEASRALAQDVELAFDLLQHGLDHAERL